MTRRARTAISSSSSSTTPAGTPTRAPRTARRAGTGRGATVANGAVTAAEGYDVLTGARLVGIDQEHGGASVQARGLVHPAEA